MVQFFLLSADEAEVIFTRVTGTVRASWHATMRRVGVSEQDCEAIRSAFLYDDLFSRRGHKMFDGGRVRMFARRCSGSAYGYL